MIHIQSPFLKDIPDCKVVMRKLRKKIYKYTSTHRPIKKPKDSIHDILTLLKPRKLPDFLVDSIKKRRNFDLSSIKNVVVPQGAEFPEMKSMGSQQEQEIEKLFKQHKSRMRNLQKKNTIKFEKRSTTYSSTEEESINEDCSIFEEEENLGAEIKDSENIPSITHDSQDNHFRDDYCVFRSHGFLALEKDLYSQEEWLKF